MSADRGSPDVNSVELRYMARLEERMDKLSEGVSRIHSDLATLNERMKRTDEYHLRIAALENKIVSLEVKLADHNFVKRVVQAAILGVLSMVGIALWALLVKQ